MIEWEFWASAFIIALVCLVAFLSGVVVGSDCERKRWQKREQDEKRNPFGVRLNRKFEDTRSKDQIMDELLETLAKRNQERPR